MLWPTVASWAHLTDGLWISLQHVNIRTGKWSESVAGLGSNADSFFEYLLKMYLLFGDEVGTRGSCLHGSARCIAQRCARNTI